MKAIIDTTPDDQDDYKVDVEVGYDDTFNLDHTLALIIHPALVQFKKDNEGMSYCAVDKEDAPEHLHGTYDEHGYSSEAYDWLIDEMIYAFWWIIEGEDKFYDREYEKDPSSYWKKVEVEEKRVQNGTRLFGKYYQGLWI